MHFPGYYRAVVLIADLLICSALQSTGLHCSPCSALHFTALGKVLKSLLIYFSFELIF